MARPNPRRRPSPHEAQPRAVAPEARRSIAYDVPKTLRKGATFHAPASPIADLDDPVLHVPSLPQRSPTCLGLGEEVDNDRALRIAQWIRSVDQTLARPGVSPSTPVCYRRDEELPLPPGMLEAAVKKEASGPASVAHVDDGVSVITASSSSGIINDRAGGLDDRRPAERSRRRRMHQRQVSDSGIGSSVSGTVRSSSDAETENGLVKRPLTAITRTITLVPLGATGEPAALSPQAARLIQKLIVEPILQRAPLSDFHPLVQDVPRRIEAKELLCLRDLEKTLIHLAPASAKTPQSYLLFCETSIQHIHTAASHISERELRRHTDAPYTNGYFVDLVEQVREYARTMAASRQRRAAGAVVDADEADAEGYSTSDEVKLEGGLSQTGRPARLVRVKKGKALAIEVSASASASAKSRPYGAASVASKRTLDEDLDDDEDEDVAQRSMARRRKLAPGESVSAPVLHTCSECRRAFKRPCDLTKHEKTHSRPWKCFEASCKYHSLGWPTEKERDRHYNDKHSASPAMYVCKYPPCTYRSKRESNCKQHMEKSHGWEYKRAKGNGKKSGGGGGGGDAPQQTPSSTAPETATPDSLDEHPFATPVTPTDARGSLSGGDNGTSFDQLAAGQITMQLGRTEVVAQDQAHWPTLWSAEPTMGSPGMGPGPVETTLSPSAPVGSSSFASDTLMGMDFHLNQTPQYDVDVGAGIGGWANLNHFEGAGPAQLLTPQRSVERRPYGSFSNDPHHHPIDSHFLGAATDEHMLDTSPLAPSMQAMSSSDPQQAHLTLCSPSSAEHFFEDETFGELQQQQHVPSHPGTSAAGGGVDFALYDPTGPGFTEAEAASLTQAFFPALPPFDQSLQLSQQQQQQPSSSSSSSSSSQHQQLYPSLPSQPQPQSQSQSQLPPLQSTAHTSATSQIGAAHAQTLAHARAQGLSTPPVDFLADFIMDTDN